MTLLYLTEDDVARLLTMDLALEAVEAGFRTLSLQEAENVPRTRCRTDQVMLHVLAASAKSLGILGLKAYTTSRQGARFHVLLYDGRTGEMTALIEADYLGQMRTGAASGIATRWLARPDAAVVGVFGSGKQARSQVEAVCRVRPIREVRVYSPTSAHCDEFAQQMSKRCGVTVKPVAEPAQAAWDCDIVITATSSVDPVLLGEWLAEGTHLNVIGSNFLAKREIDQEVLQRANLIVVDSREQARIEAGDLKPGVDAGIVDWRDVRELSDVVTRRVPGREHPSEITLFKSLGLGIEDVAVAARVVEQAKARGIGRALLG